MRYEEAVRAYYHRIVSGPDWYIYREQVEFLRKIDRIALD